AAGRDSGGSLIQVGGDGRGDGGRTRDGGTELRTRAAARVEGRVDVGVVVLRIGHDVGERGRVRHRRRVPEVVPSARVGGEVGVEGRHHRDRDASVHALGGIVDVQAGKCRGRGEPVVHVEEHGAGRNRTILVANGVQRDERWRGTYQFGGSGFVGRIERD